MHTCYLQIGDRKLRLLCDKTATFLWFGNFWIEGMQIYTPGADVGTLQPWPFDNPESNYKILAGAPAASGRIDTGGPGYTSRSGVWRCTSGTFECTEQGDELMTILSGRCRLTDQLSGESHELSPGDSLFMPDGCRVKWEVIKEVTKVFFGNKPSGF